MAAKVLSTNARTQAEGWNSNASAINFNERVIASMGEPEKVTGIIGHCRSMVASALRACGAAVGWVGNKAHSLGHWPGNLATRAAIWANDTARKVTGVVLTKGAPGVFYGPANWIAPKAA